MITVPGLEKTAYIDWDINFNNITTSPEFLTNVHSVLFDEDNWGKEEAFDKKLAYATSIDWNGADMPYTARYLNIPGGIHLNTTSELIDIIERICTKLNAGRIVITVNVTQSHDNCGIAPILDVYISSPQSGTVELNMDYDGVNIVNEDGYFTGGHIDSGTEYHVRIKNTDNFLTKLSKVTSANDLAAAFFMSDVDFKVIFTPDDERYTNVKNQQLLELPYIFIKDIRFDNIENDTVEISIEKTIDRQTVSVNGASYNIADAAGYLNNANIKWSDNTSASINTSKLVYHLYSNIDRTDRTPLTYKRGDPVNDYIIDILQSPGTYYIFGYYTDAQEYTSNYITLKVTDSTAIPQGYYFGILTNTDSAYVTASNYTDTSIEGINKVFDTDSIIYNGVKSINNNGEYLYVILPVGFTLEVTKVNDNTFTTNMARYANNINIYTPYASDTNCILDDSYILYRSTQMCYADVKINIIKNA